MLRASDSIFVDGVVLSLTNRSVRLILLLPFTVILKVEQFGQHHAECEPNTSDLVLTVNPSTCGVADVYGQKPVSISDTSRPLELFAFCMNSIIVVSHVLTVALSIVLFEVASKGDFEGKTSSSSS